jgi:hypothetical protein
MRTKDLLLIQNVNFTAHFAATWTLLPGVNAPPPLQLRCLADVHTFLDFELLDHSEVFPGYSRMHPLMGVCDFRDLLNR